MSAVLKRATWVLKGLWTTVRYLKPGHRPFTMKYPEEKRALPEGFRGFPKLNRDDKGNEKCVACYLCEVVCPVGAIKLEAKENTDPELGRDRRPAYFYINMGRCICCGLCEEACPVDSIVMGTTYELHAESRHEFVYDIEKLLNLP